MNERETCYCGSLNRYSACCGIFHHGYKEGVVAPTANALMRSRYSAYCLQLLEYLSHTHHRDNPDGNYDLIPHSQTEWVRLELLNIEQGMDQDSEGYVEFAAYYNDGGAPGVIHERSFFLKENNEWFYRSGQQYPANASLSSKMGRNMPCWCNSQKKYKQCHGK